MTNMTIQEAITDLLFAASCRSLNDIDRTETMSRTTALELNAEEAKLTETIEFVRNWANKEFDIEIVI